ncbi:hypothetical protein ACLOJK_017253 [Asimina triloba]
MPPEIVKDRWLGFLIWQAISSSSILLAYKTAFLSPFLSLVALLSFLAFHLALLLFSLSLFLISSPHPDPTASVSDLALGFLRLFLRSVVAGAPLDFSTSNFRRRATKSLWILLFLIGCGVAGLLALIAICGESQQLDGAGLMAVGLRGLVFGLVYGVHYVYWKRWVLAFPIIQVLHTRRCIFAPPQGSAAAETNPSEPLLEALEQSPPRSLYQYLAYLDLCMVSESNVDAWRRAAFFEETGETYRRVISVCLRPLEQLTSKISEGLEGSSAGKSDLLSQQLSLPKETVVDSRLHEAFNDFQICTWSARTLAALTICSHREDRFGIAQLTGSNASVVSAFLSCLLAVEACLGKKTNPQSAHLISPTNIRFATVNTGRRDGPTAVVGKRRGGALYSKAYAMADVLRTSIYGIVSVFYDEMQANAKAANLEKDWIVRSKPLYGTQEILLKLQSAFCFGLWSREEKMTFEWIVVAGNFFNLEGNR